MNGKQRAVLWIGLILVALNLAKNWQSIRSIIFSGAGGAVNAPSGDPNSGGISVVPGIPASPGGGVTLPFGGFPVTIPLPSNINAGITPREQQVSGNVAGRSPTGTVSGSRL